MSFTTKTNTKAKVIKDAKVGDSRRLVVVSLNAYGELGETKWDDMRPASCAQGTRDEWIRLAVEYPDGCCILDGSGERDANGFMVY
jgi:hypothetical protein